MYFPQPKTLEDAYIYFADCAVANLSYFLLQKNKPKYERDRHMSICNKMIEQGKRFNIDMSKIEERLHNIIRISKEMGYWKE